MRWATVETVRKLFAMACETPVIDAHTHIQDDLTGFDQGLAKGNLAGTQAGINRFPGYLVKEGLRRGRLARRTMMDLTHGLCYSWFAQVVEGRRGRLDEAIAALGNNSEQQRLQAGRIMLEELWDSRYSEYAEWLRYMFRLYPGVPEDPLRPETAEATYGAIKAWRSDPAFAQKILAEHQVVGYVTSIENRDRIPLEAAGCTLGQVDLGHATHPEAYNMFDANYLVWPEGATDFGLFLAGHKYQAERYLLVLEEKLGEAITSRRQLAQAIEGFLRRILWSPVTNPASRIRYTDLFHPIDFRLNAPWDPAAVETAIRYHKGALHGEQREQVVRCACQALLQALDDIGAEMRRHGERHGSCLQIAVGVTYFMDPAREIQSFPIYQAGLPQAEHAAWVAYPNVHFEYLCAHPMLYHDYATAAKQVANVSVGPWWHFFRKHQMAAMLYDQLSMGPVSAIASGFTDARFVEMLAAKYRSVRWAVALALAELCDDPASSLTLEGAPGLLRELLLENPAAVHHLPLA